MQYRLARQLHGRDTALPKVIPIKKLPKKNDMPMTVCFDDAQDARFDPELCLRFSQGCFIHWCQAQAEALQAMLSRAQPCSDVVHCCSLNESDGSLLLKQMLLLQAGTRQVTLLGFIRGEVRLIIHNT